MAARYGHSWVSQYGESPDGIAAAEWRTTLAGVTAAQILDGFATDAARGGEWPPSSTSFRAMCLSIPILAQVRREVRTYENLGGHAPISGFGFAVHRVVYLSDYGLSGKGDEGILRDAYELMREVVMRGETLPVAPVAALSVDSSPSIAPATREQVAAHLAAFAAVLNAT